MIPGIDVPHGTCRHALHSRTLGRVVHWVAPEPALHLAGWHGRRHPGAQLLHCHKPDIPPLGNFGNEARQCLAVERFGSEPASTRAKVSVVQQSRPNFQQPKSYIMQHHSQHMPWGVQVNPNWGAVVLVGVVELLQHLGQQRIARGGCGVLQVQQHDGTQHVRLVAVQQLQGEASSICATPWWTVRLQWG